MDGNRGAKGSIKDRLISLLYRLRYQKKVLKEEEYTKERKKIQEEYLELLQKFNEQEDINILDDTDKERLDDVKFVGTFNLDSNEINSLFDKPIKLEDNIVDIKLPRGIDMVDNQIKIGNNKFEANLTDLELSSSELDEKVDLKNEIKKTKEEIDIIDEVDNFIKESLENLEQINTEIEQIKIESKNKNQDITKLETRYKELRKKVDKLKKQYDTIKNKYDLSDFKIIESIKLIDTIDDYKNVARLNEMDMMVKICKKEIEKIDSITIINVEKKKVGNTIENIKEDQAKVKIKFNNSKNKVDELSSLKEKLAEEIENQKNIVDEMYEKASKIEKEVTKTIECESHKNLLSSFLRITGGILTIPFTGKNIFGHALGATLINKGLKELNKSYERKEKIKIEYKYEDIENKLRNVKDIVEYTNLVISDSLVEIKKLKTNFANEYSKYSNVIPNYNVTLNELNNLELKLLEEQEKIGKINKKIEEEKNLNNQKIKKIGELSSNNK